MSTEVTEIVKAGDVKREIARRMPAEITPAIEAALMIGDLKGLSPEQRVQFYHAVCESVGLNPLTRPFEYVILNGKTTLYARKDCTDQLRSIHDVSVKIVSREMVGDAWVVKSRAVLPNGREDESIGAVSLKGLTGEAYANAIMKAETKSKRRVTLSICGLGFLDETEVDQPRRPAFRYEASADEPELTQIPAGAQPEGDLTEDDLLEITTALADKKLTMAQLETWLAKNGSSLKAATRDKLDSIHKWINAAKSA